MTIKASEITFLIEQFSQSGWDELHVEVNGLHLYLSTSPAAPGAARTAAQTAFPAAVVAPAAAAAPAVQATTSLPAGLNAVPSAWLAIKAPNLGTFYRSPKPGAPPFVDVGQSISAHSEICLLEVMKLFTAVQAGVAGVVRQICVNDSEMVEHDQVLMYVEPA